MASRQLLRLVVIPIVQHGSVVAGDDQDGVACDAQTVELGSDGTHRLIEREDGFTAQPHRAPPAEALVWHARHMDIIGAEIHEEWTARRAALVHEAHGMGRDTVGYVLVAPQCPAPSFHIADAADAVDDAHVMPVAGA